MELNNVDRADTAETSFLRRGQSVNGSAGHADIYEPAQDILDACKRDLEELRMKILKSSVRCHMLEVDLATQFNPQNQQLYADAQEACQKCAKTILSIGQDVSKERTTPAATEMPISTLPATSTTEHQVSIMMVTPAVAAQEDSSVTTTPAIDAEQVSTAAISQAVAEQQVSIPTIMPVVPEQQVFTESSAPPTEKSLAPDVGHTNGDSQVASIVADCMEEGSQ